MWFHFVKEFRQNKDKERIWIEHYMTRKTPPAWFWWVCPILALLVAGIVCFIDAPMLYFRFLIEEMGPFVLGVVLFTSPIWIGELRHRAHMKEQDDVDGRNL